MNKASNIAKYRNAFTQVEVVYSLSLYQLYANVFLTLAFASTSFLSNQNDFPSTVMTRSGLSLEELRIVEGQGQSSEVITPSEELNRINDMGTAARPSPLHS